MMEGVAGFILYLFLFFSLSVVVGATTLVQPVYLVYPQPKHSIRFAFFGLRKGRGQRGIAFIKDRLRKTHVWDYFLGRRPGTIW